LSSLGNKYSLILSNFDIWGYNNIGVLEFIRVNIDCVVKM
jgi:hypothetical protein